VKKIDINFTGAWSADLLKSRLLAPPPKSLSVQIIQSDTELQEEMVVTKLDGGEERVIFKCRIDRAQHNGSLNGRPIRCAVRWEGSELVIESWVQLGAREMYLCDVWSLADDGQTLVMQHRNDDLAGQVTFLDRVK
jgi:hypothetical protein